MKRQTKIRISSTERPGVRVNGETTKFVVQTEYMQFAKQRLVSLQSQSQDSVDARCRDAVVSVL